MDVEDLLDHALNGILRRVDNRIGVHRRECQERHKAGSAELRRGTIESASLHNACSHSSSTYSNSTNETIKNAASTTTSRRSSGEGNVPRSKSAALARTAPSRRGTMTGKRRSGSMTSR